MTPSRIIGCLTIAVALLAIGASAQQCANLGTIGNYAVLSVAGTDSTPVNSGTSISGMFGISVGAPSGLTSTQIVPTSVANPVQIGAGSSAPADVQSATTVYNTVSATTPTTTYTGNRELSTTSTLTSGTYSITGSATLTGTLTLSGTGPFNFIVAGTLTFAANARIVLANGATACCVVFTVNGAITTGTGAQIVGLYISRAGITLGTNTNVNGGVISLSTTARVTMDSTTIVSPLCGSGSVVVTNTFAYVFLSLNQCSGTTTTGNYGCASSTTGSSTWTAASSSSCTGTLSVICLNGASSGTQVQCATGVPSQATSFASLQNTVYQCAVAPTTTYAWVFQSYPTCSGACGTTSTYSPTFGCAQSSSSSPGVWTSATTGNCAAAGTINVICLSGNSQFACSSLGVPQPTGGFPTTSNSLTQLQSLQVQCTTQACPVGITALGSWCVQGWSQCSASCGPNGIRTRIVSCTNQNNGASIDASQCDQATRPASQESCNTAACPVFTWLASTWSTCSSNCRGTQTRTIRCVSNYDMTTAASSESLCNSVTRPSTARSCNTDDSTCVNYYWVPRGYTSCFPTCGTNSVQTQAYLCYGSTNPDSSAFNVNNPATDPFAFVVDNSLCPTSTILQTTRSCSVPACTNSPVYSWQSSGFGACSAPVCGGGVQTQTVWCQSSQSATPVDNKLCLDNLPLQSKPSSSVACNTQACASYHWVPTGYGACSVSCGFGTRTRTNLCYAGPAIVNGVASTDTTTLVANSFCQGLVAPPVTMEPCNTQACAAVYNWYAGAWSGCNVDCGGGVQYREVGCWSSESDAREPVSDSKCSPIPRPVSSQNCNQAPCVQYVWSEPLWSECSCLTSTQTRTPQCFLRAADGTATGLPVADTLCSGQTNPNNPALPCPWALAKPSSVQACQPQNCGIYYWWADSWSTCQNSLGGFVPCGGGIQSRTVQCWSLADETAPVADSFCSSISAFKPAAAQSCNTQACVSYSWVPTAWCMCNKACGGGNQTRSLQCMQNDGVSTVAVADLYCSGQSTLSFALIATCNTQPCATFVWVVGDYSSCNKNCGCGRQTRVVYCASSLNTLIAVSDDKCIAANIGPKPITQTQCNTTPCPAKYYWAVTPYSNCTATCGGGTQTRTATCYWTDLPDLTCQINRWPVAADQVAALCPTPSPRLTRSCNQQPCVTYQWYTSAWSQCSATCGGGQQYRTVQCYGSDDNRNFVKESLCTGVKPSFSQQCNTQSCNSYLWITSPWGTCSTTCGGGVQTRTVGCYNWANKDVQVADSFCADQTNQIIGTGVRDIGATTGRPMTTQVCNTCSCPPSYQWYAGVWGSCSAPCGGGVQTRSVNCYGSDNPNAFVSDSVCNAVTPALTKPVSTTPCNLQACERYYWSTGVWSSCPSCGSASQTRSVRCFKQSDDINAVDDSFCASAGVKPSVSQTCAIPQCPTCNWRATANFGPCSKSCNGIATRIVECYCTSDNLVPADPSNCANIPRLGGATQSYTQACNVNAIGCTETFTWRAIGPSTCSSVNGLGCGAGTQTYVVYCQSSLDGAPVADSFCANSGVRPAVSVTCQLAACPVYAWKAFAYEACPVTCGTSVANRIVGCYLASDTSTFFTGTFPYPESFCNPSTRPTTSTPCTGVLGATCAIVTVNTWYTSPQGLCSANCGGGVAAVAVFCRSGTNSFIPLPDSQCTGAKPATQVTCNTQACPANYCLQSRNDILSCWEIDYGRKGAFEASTCAWNTFMTTSTGSIYSWFTGPWSACSASRTQTRNVSCRINNANAVTSYIVSNTLCSVSSQPASSQAC